MTTDHHERGIGQPLGLAILLTVALTLSFRYYYLPSTLSTFPDRFLANDFCQLILATFITALLYALFQTLGLGIEDQRLQTTAPDKPPSRWRYLLSGREPLTSPRITPLSVDQPPQQEHRYQVYWHRGQQRLAPLQFAVWVLPMLGFIGTVVGIIRAIGGLEAALDRSGAEAGLATVLGGLSFAFDTTLLGLLLVIPLMVILLMLRQRLQQQALRYRGLLLEHSSNPGSEQHDTAPESA